MRDRLEDLEAKESTPRRESSRINEKLAREHKSEFEKWMRDPGDSGAQQRLSNVQEEVRRKRQELEGKSISIGTPSQGGYAVPEEISREIERQEKKFSPVRNIVKIQRVSSNDNKHLINLRGGTAGWVGETGSRSETDTPLLRERAPTMGELYAYPKASEWALDDVFFNVANWLAEEVAQEFAQEEGAAVLTGNGSNKPTGMLNATPELTADFASPLRSAAAYEYVACPATTSPGIAEILGDCLIDLVYSVNSVYRANGRWTMNSATAATVRKLKDSQGQYLWQMSLMEGQPERLLGYPVEIWEDMDDVGSDKFPIAFGDFRRGYLLVERGDIRITVDNNITQPGYVKFYVRRREGGCVLNNDAIKFLRTTVS